MCRNYDGRVLADVAGGFLGTGLDYERTEASEIHVLAVCETVFHYGHEMLYHGENGWLIDAGHSGYLVNYICFSHIVVNLMSFTNAKLLKIGRLSLTLEDDNGVSGALKALRLFDYVTRLLFARIPSGESSPSSCLSEPTQLAAE